MSKSPQEVDFDGVKARVTGPAMEAITDVFHRMPWGEKIILANGKVGIIKKFVEPHIAHRDIPDWPYEGCESFGFDITAEDGSWHMEFYVFRTGWGGAP